MIDNKILLFLCFILILVSLLLIYIGLAGGYNIYTIVAVSGIYSITAGDNPTLEFTIYEDNSIIPRTVGEFLVDLQKASTGFDAVHTPGDKIYLTGYEKIDSSDYRRYDQAEFIAGSIKNNGIFKNIMTNKPVKFTIRTSADRGAFQLPYSWTYRNEQ